MPKKIDVPPGMAHCGKCKQVMNKDCFHKTIKNTNGVDGYCKKCRLGYHQVKYDQKPLVIPPPGHRYCPHCDKVKPNVCFHEGLLRQKRLRSLYCKECRSNIAYREPRRNDPRGGKKYGIEHHSFKPMTRDVSTDTAKLAYAAGIFDGEGSAQIMPSNSATPIMSVAGNNECILSAFKDTMGGILNFYDRPMEYADGTRAIISEGRININTLANISAACTSLMPFLFVKKDRCEILLEATASSPEKRLLLRDKIDVLNKTGISEHFEPRLAKKLSSASISDVPDTDYAYLAGLCDGEGWIGIRNGSAPIIQFAMTRSGGMGHIQDIFGGRMFTSMRPNGQANAIYLSMGFSDHATWDYFLLRLSPFLILKKEHCDLARRSIDRSRKEKIEIQREMEQLTANSKLEKFKRVKHQLASFKSRMILGENGILVGIRDIIHNGNEFEPKNENQKGFDL